jgi:hypothetical protein
MSFGVMGIDPDRGAELGDRLVPHPLAGQHSVEPAVGPRALRPKADRDVVFGDCRLSLPLAAQGVSETLTCRLGRRLARFPWAAFRANGLLAPTQELLPFPAPTSLRRVVVVSRCSSALGLIPWWSKER